MLCQKLKSRDIINGLSLDERIGDHYNNPSFGYGGYCFQKIQNKLLANFNDIPQDLVSSVINSNQTRKDLLQIRFWKEI